MVWTALAAAFLVALCLIPVARRLSLRTGLVASPRKDRWHKTPTPKMGGLAIFGGYLAGVLVGYAAGGGIRWELILAPGLVFALGLLDDYRQLAPTTKLLGQILAASLVVFFGYTIDFFEWSILNVILTFVWVVGITNAINLLDNMDGLAAGISLIAAILLSLLFIDGGNPTLLIASLALAGSVAAFLIFNFPPASIFMGDSGSLFLGYTLAAIAIARAPRASNVFAVLGVPVLIFLLPIIDTLLVTITRLLRGQSPAQGGSDHTSHRLVAFGLSERGAVLALYAIAILAGIAGTVLETLDYGLSLVLVPMLLVSLALAAAYLGRLKVVSAEPAPKGAISRVIVELTFRRRILEIFLDFILISVAYYMAFWVSSGFSLDAETLDFVFRTLPVAFAGIYLSYFLFGVYRGVWRYAGVDELFRYLLAVLGGSASVAVILNILFPDVEIAPGVFVLFGVFLLSGLVASRFSFLVLDRVYGRQASKGQESSVLIFGAGDTGEMALRWILMNPGVGYRPVGFIDDDPFKRGRRIQGVYVLGGVGDLEKILNDRQVDGIILTPDGGEGVSETLLQALEVSRDKGVWVRKLRFEFELIE
jgi:UDP-GlcNAc:undecaprenyl-phosphate GlcNAc-1-phosphate transferase